MSATPLPHVFFQKSRRTNKINHVTRERYLRSDVGLGFIPASETANNNNNPQCIHDETALTEALQDEFLDDATGLPLLLILDTNIVLHQLDFLESDCAALSNAVICDTVLRETRKNNLGAYNRLLRLTRQTSTRTFICFPNENHSSTYRNKTVDESDNDFNDALIRAVAHWFANKMQRKARVVLLTDDVENRARCNREYNAGGGGAKALSCKELCVELRLKWPTLEDRLNLSSSTGTTTTTTSAETGGGIFPPFLDRSEVETRLANKSLIKGVLRMERSSDGEPKASVGMEDTRIIIEGAMNLNRGVEGDVVIVAPQAPSRVVHIWKRNWRRLVGCIITSQDYDATTTTTTAPDDAADDEPTFSSSARQQRVLFAPLDSKYPRIRISTRQLDALRDQRIVVQIDGWDATSKFPHGHVVQIVGPIGDRATETACILLEHNIPTAEFSKAVLRCLPPADFVASSQLVPGSSPSRVDLRNLDGLCSIDPPGCKDIDDALHARVLPGNLIEIGVHIADVTHFVRPGTPLDVEAMNRGTSTYLVEKRLDMLPSLLTTDLCSLVSNVDRLAFSVIWNVDPVTLQFVGETKFFKSVIRSRASLTYDQAQTFLDDATISGAVPDGVRLLNRIAKKLHGERIEAGALTLASQEVRFQLDDETRDPTEVKKYEHKDSHSLVEEFMLLANVHVAQRIESKFPSRALLRRHPHPYAEALTQLRDCAKAAGVMLDTTSSKTLSDSLNTAQKPDSPFFNELLRIMTTRAMQQAVYFCTGDFADGKEFWHYGLAVPLYTHFTSPIRRYADVVAHRMLAAAQDLEPMARAYETKESVREIAQHINERHHEALLAGRASVELNTVLFFRTRGVVETDAYVSGITSKRVNVMIPEYGLEDRLFVQPGEEEAWVRNETELWFSTTTGHRWHITDKLRVTVQVVKADGAAQKQFLRVEMVGGDGGAKKRESKSDGGSEIKRMRR